MYISIDKSGPKLQEEKSMKDRIIECIQNPDAFLSSYGDGKMKSEQEWIKW